MTWGTSVAFHTFSCIVLELSTTSFYVDVFDLGLSVARSLFVPFSSLRQSPEPLELFLSSVVSSSSSRIVRLLAYTIPKT